MKLVRILGLASALGLGITAWLVFYWAPLEQAMGFVQKIMYIHVPSVLVCYLAFFISFLASVGYLWKRTEGYDVVALCSAEIGVIFCGITLVTGAIWGKPTWNTYWTWDARLTTTLILFLIFVGYLLLRRFVEFSEQQARFAAIIAIIGFLDIPLIHQAVTWWRTLHQTSTLFSMKPGGAIDDPLKWMLYVAMVAFYLFFAYLLTKRIQLERQERELRRTLAALE
ncbi:MAG: cytochrome C assembly protein [Candidatus Lambdaproteobacteria bacterium RIFOXYD1_FULL_56_27]|uniref:Heme exporter protein C n=1 Tax=Candidatus Lambdaproteobacteria bacterium RIFOXYD2_FULL_56_26 TaxID=1817773 RepID=A0A1F6H0F7_9PROT|nr:MAG: cytochrome C assembly protein [Candidatus Lambdaproteobacteria bacterium RIFOXYC1_FULL_56_13]OGH03784.1 MAG: cytochrome C assembly protein [Candidatus Lambdaproteobacteria bacterium RIFOXYD2_FULL_56_26]OGH08779.1 MAG: cytochrome C assembly protein [Candidatus Lambdaproteobacteria bacterium RIFOXYD1_FULL_56_27]